MAQIQANGISIEYESFGAPDRQAILLITGHGGQLTSWPEDLCEELVRQGYRVIRYDNRDSGLSTKFDHAGVPNWDEIRRRQAAGLPLELPYTLDDMALDAIALMDALGIEKAHIVGASMGGMIAQLVAADYPRRTLSLTTMMCTASNPAIPLLKPELLARYTPPPETDDIAKIMEHQLPFYEMMAGPESPVTPNARRARVLADARRFYSPSCFARHGAASGTAPDRRKKLETIKVPATVLHGALDPGVPLEGAYDIAKHLADVELMIIPGMGHELPAELAPTLAKAILSSTTRANGNKRPAS